MMIEIYPDHEQLSLAAAHYFVQQAKQAITKEGCFSVVLSGGQTPKRAYELLAQPSFQSQIDWQHIFIFWGDERCVPPDDPKSNERMARQALLDKVAIPPNQIFPMRCQSDPELAAQEYEGQIQGFFNRQKPQFDLIFLGLGKNGHTASLFPHHTVLHNIQQWVAPLYVAEENMYRLTMTTTLINQSKKIVFLVSGSEKAEILPKIIDGPCNPEEFPAQLIHPAQGELQWFVDKATTQFLQGQKQPEKCILWHP